MSGTGYNNAQMLAAAKELSQSFKSGGKDKKGGGMRSSSNSGSTRRQESFQYPPPPPAPVGFSNVPPPSQRKYTDTLAPGSYRHASGKFLGSAMGFLSRQESPSMPTSTGLPQETASQVVAAVAASGTPSPDVKASSQHHDNTAASEKKALPSVSIQGTGNSKPDNDSKVSKATVTGQTLSTIKGLTTPTPPTPPTPAQRQSTLPAVSFGTGPKNDIAKTFFDLMSEDSEGEADEVPQTPKPKIAVQHDASNLTKQSEEDLISISPDNKLGTSNGESIPERLFSPKGKTNGVATREFSHNIAPLSQKDTNGSVQGPPSTQHAFGEPVASQNQTRGKPEPLSPTPGPKLRPHAPRFVPASGSSETSSKCIDVTLSTMDDVLATRLSAEAPEWAPKHQAHARQASPASGNSSPFIEGHIVTVTRIRIADGCVFSGPSNGQLIMHQQAATFTQPQASGMQLPTMPMASASGLLTQNDKNGVLDSARKPAPSRKPTKGLRSSMWAN
ncbi:hypothetical protein FALBO_5529 [Fusarium albosuccineum]|uniref:Uncharacterized protein n=1 Tax=Fusarium albosuccineum TaxID=1237068 RepID=A0A8H4LEP3_9HYPO|nr:hypothetical protein FALBO_5529 [Fusarium albosuccineum]